ncbi:MAG: CRISPR-associated endonuclease Cas1 [Hydrogenophaga sp.]|nr:CRISPR-associated endonuclease Cas1 [Hydrogenophaga sp.]
MNTPLANARPLYLQNGSAHRLGLDTTQRLRIERKDQPERRIPLHHVSRIVCSSTLDISSAALMACMQQGIPLCIVNPDGTPLGWCLGTRRKETTLRQLLTHALDDPAWSLYYSHWLHSQKMAIAAHTLLLCGVPATAAARQNPRTALCNAHFQKHQQACAQHINALTLLAQHEMTAHLSRETSDPQLLAWHRPGLNLLHDLGQLLGLYAHTDLHHVHHLPKQDDITPWAIQHHERHAAHWQQRIAHLMHGFEQFLRIHWL